MKIVGEREGLLRAFQTAATVAPSRSPKPILQNINLDVTDKGGTMIATDMEVGIRIEAAGIEVLTPGSVVLPVDRVGSILRESSDEKLTIEADLQGTVIKGGRSVFKLPAENPDEFPPVTDFKETRYHEVSAKLFRELIRRTIFATDTESSRYALGGVLLEFEQAKIVGVGTDGRRLAKMEGPAMSVAGHLTGDTMTIVPTRAMQLIERAISDSDGVVRIAARANDILVNTPRVTIHSRLVEGRFPRWRDVFPDRRDPIRIELTVGPALSAHKQAAIVASQESRGIDFTFGEGSLVMQASTAERGQSRVEVPISYPGVPVTLTLDHRFVSDFLRVLESDGLFTIDIQDGASAALFTTDDGYGYVVMPLESKKV